jgi:nucleoid DNA-binding protein
MVLIVKKIRIKKMAKKEVVPTTKSGIILALAGAGEITKKQAVAVYEKLIDLAIKGAKQEEKGYMLPGLGKVKLVKRAARTGINPFTKETIKIKAKKVVKIVACKALKDAIAGK